MIDMVSIDDTPNMSPLYIIPLYAKADICHPAVLSLCAINDLCHLKIMSLNFVSVLH